MIGFDLQEVAKIKDTEKLLQKIALDGEIAYIKKFKCDFAVHVATLWAVKEATYKALGVKEGEISYKEIELCHKDSGQPFLVLHGKTKDIFDAHGFKKLDISISHQPSIVGAVVLAE